VVAQELRERGTHGGAVPQQAEQDMALEELDPGFGEVQTEVASALSARCRRRAPPGPRKEVCRRRRGHQGKARAVARGDAVRPAWVSASWNNSMDAVMAWLRLFKQRGSPPTAAGSAETAAEL